MVGPVSEDGKEKAHGDPMGQKGADSSSLGGEAFHQAERGLGQGQAIVEVVGGVQGR